MSALELDTLYCGDRLDWMQQWDDQCVDLIYPDAGSDWHKEHCARRIFDEGYQEIEATGQTPAAPSRTCAPDLPGIRGRA